MEENGERAPCFLCLSVCLSVCLYVSLCLCLCLSVCLCLCLYLLSLSAVSVSVSVCLCLSVSLCLRLSLCLSLEPLSNSSIAQVLKNIENNYLKFWQGEITASKKLDFYRKFKQDFSVSSYIDILRNRGTRKSFVKFYLSNHKLCIESGRHRRPVLPREERICAVCKNNEIEDEAHMLFSCTLYNTLCEQFLIKQQHILNTAFDNYDYWLNIGFHNRKQSFDSHHCKIYISVFLTKRRC